VTAFRGRAATVVRGLSRNIAVLKSARGMSFGSLLARAGARLGLAGLCLLGIHSSLENAIANGDTRTLTFHHLHTGEDITVTFKRDGRYDEAALKKLNWFMRDWRKEQETQMDPHLFDLLWEVQRDVGAAGPIDVVCGYRSPETNAMLRARSNGVAQFSQHTLGHAMDFYIPGVPLAKIREVGLKLQRGGVGFYPTSGSPFVHLDTGTIRHWPRIARAELMKIFPDGRTVHIPSDGQPLKNYALALNDVERAGHMPNSVSLEAAQSAGVITAAQARSVPQDRNADEQEDRSTAKPERGLLAQLFNPTPKHDVVNTEASDDPPAPALIAAASPPPKPVTVSRIVPLPIARPKVVEVAAATPPAPPAAAPAPAPAAVADNNPFSDPDFWRNVDKTPASAPKAPFELASIDQPVTTGTTAPPLAYASESAPVAPPPAKAKPMGARLPQLASAANAAPAPVNDGPSLSGLIPIGGQQAGSPWMRAMMLAPNMTGFMTMTRVGKTDPRWLTDLLRKPPQALAMSFAGDPNGGMTTSRFTGSAVVFLATATFVNAKTASLQ